MVDGCNILGMNVTNDEINLFYCKYNKSKDGKLRYSEFCDAF